MSDIVIIGGGFAGLWAALAARREADAQGRDLAISLISKDDQLTLRPRLYEARPERFRIPLGPTLAPVDIDLITATVAAVDTANNTITLKDRNAPLSYERLVLALGSVLAPLPIPGAERAFDIDDWQGAMTFDGHLKARMPALTKPVVSVIGAGFTGLEIALELRQRIEAASDLATAKAARIILLDRAGVVGAELSDNPRPAIEAALAAAAIEVRLGVDIAGLDADGLCFADGSHLASDMVIACGGLMANPLGREIPAAHDASGRLMVDPDLRVAGLSRVFAGGDIAHAETDAAGHVAMMSCQHAMTMGRYAGYNAARDLLALETTPYRQERYVSCLDLGAAGAVFTTGWDRQVQMTGAAAKKVKQRINGEVIYPPQGSRAEILAAAALVPEHHKLPPENR